MYEFLCGGVPYGEDLEDPFEINEVILKSRALKYPHCENKLAISLIETLLSKLPVRRLKGSYSNLKSHEFFKGFNFVSI